MQIAIYAACRMKITSFIQSNFFCSILYGIFEIGSAWNTTERVKAVYRRLPFFAVALCLSYRALRLPYFISGVSATTEKSFEKLNFVELGFSVLFFLSI